MRQPAVTFTALIVLLSLAVPGAQTNSVVELERYVRAGFESFNSGDPVLIAASGFTGFEPGFGYRTRAPRLPRSAEATLSGIKEVLSTMTYFRLAVREVHAQVDGDVGVAWGFYTEEFQRRGQGPEVVNARFSVTLKREGNRWRTLLFHRDTQPFDSAGRYLADQLAPPR